VGSDVYETETIVEVLGPHLHFDLLKITNIMNEERSGSIRNFSNGYLRHSVLN